MNMQFSCTLYSGIYLDKKYHSVLAKDNPTKTEMLGTKPAQN